MDMNNRPPRGMRMPPGMMGPTAAAPRKYQTRLELQVEALEDRMNGAVSTLQEGCFANVAKAIEVLMNTKDCSEEIKVAAKTVARFHAKQAQEAFFAVMPNIQIALDKLFETAGGPVTHDLEAELNEALNDEEEKPQ